ncbi:MAG: hypothetical protein KBC50_01745 [Candidatus Pacebacteria bacterium]|nr:hypothetical protein [Candidatus Paceibacterota bacterium]
MNNWLFKLRVKMGKRIGPQVMVEVDPLGEVAAAVFAATSLYIAYESFCKFMA